MRVREIGIQTVVILKPRILYDLDRVPSKIKTYKRNSKFFLVREVQEILKQLFVEPLKTALFRSITNKV